MDVAVTFAIYAIALIAVSLLGSFVPFMKKLTDNQIHLLIALSAGIFLGILFFMLLPEAFHEGCIEGDYDIRLIAGCILAGFMVIMIIEKSLKHYHMMSCPCGCHKDEHQHNLASFSTFIGLGIHAFVDGLILASSLLINSEIAWLTLGGMCIHKFVELFSLSSTFLLSERDKKTTAKYLIGYTLITPVAAIISFLLLNGVSVEGIIGIPLAISAGTFMYVALCDMLPEAFHRDDQDLKSFIFLAIGLIIAAVIFTVIGHGH